MRIKIVVVSALLAAVLIAGCDTFGEIRNAPKPENFVQLLAYAQGQIKALRKQVAFIGKIRGEDCKATPGSDFCKAAADINVKTREWRDSLDKMKMAYDSVGDLSKCSIDVGGEVLPCETKTGQIINGLVTLRALLPEGEK